MSDSGTKRQQGLTLVEVLVTLGLLTFVLLSLGKLQATLLLHDALGRQQSLAVLLAGNGLASLRLPLDAAAAPSAQRENLGPDKHCGHVMEGLDTCYERRSRAAQIAPGLWRIEVSVSWHDRQGGRQTLQLYSLAAAADPVALAALYRPPVDLLQPPPPP